MCDRNFSLKIIRILPLLGYMLPIFGGSDGSQIPVQQLKQPLCHYIPSSHSIALLQLQNPSSSMDFIKPIRYMAGIISQQIHMTMWTKSICHFGFSQIKLGQLPKKFERAVSDKIIERHSKESHLLLQNKISIPRRGEKLNL